MKSCPKLRNYWWPMACISRVLTILKRITNRIVDSETYVQVNSLENSYRSCTWCIGFLWKFQLMSNCFSLHYATEWSCKCVVLRTISLASHINQVAILRAGGTHVAILRAWSCVPDTHVGCLWYVSAIPRHAKISSAIQSHHIKMSFW